MNLSKRAEIERFLQGPPKDVRVVLIHGRDRGVVRERAQGLAVKATANPDDPFDVAQLTDTDVESDPARLETELSSLSMMGGRRLVRLRLSGDKASTDKAVAESAKAHAEGEFNPDALFLIEAGELRRDSALRKAVEVAKAGAAIVCYEDEAGDITRMVRDSLSREKVGLTTEALDLFVSRLPHERGVARQEIERLILFLGPGSGVSATPADLEDFLGVEPEASLADAAADAFGGKLAAAHASLRRAAQEGDGGPAAVRAMGMHLGKLRRTLTLAKSGAGLAEAAKASGVFWKNEREFLRQARTWTLDALDPLQVDILNADRACKTTGSPDQLIAERLALTIAGRARRLGL
ncbi:MAG TPA: DNA polymerase III subunit delta [Caulobacteraceae bacterium]|nr:DNA polymerase III subunit delta [Caulobacteraceae bacterium]